MKIYYFEIYRELLSAGSNFPWPQILHKLTGETELRVDAILEYFEPLFKWLRSQRKKLNYPIGWNKSNVPVKGKSDHNIGSQDTDKPIFLKKSSNMGLSYVRAIKKESKQQNKNASTSFSTPKNGLKTIKVNTQSQSVLGPLGQTKSSILTRPVFVPSTGKDPLTLVKTNDEKKYNPQLHG